MPELTREYLQAALRMAKKQLPAWAYAALQRHSRASAGGQVAARNRRDRLYALAKADEPTDIQTLIFPRDKFDADSSRSWARAHEFSDAKVDETDSSYRLRQREPEEFEDGSLRTIDLGEGVKAVIGQPKESAQKCDDDGPSFGDHAHHVNRAAGVTHVDGGHQHFFLLPGGEAVMTEVDGHHDHGISGDLAGDTRSEHKHWVNLPDGGGTWTETDGSHRHDVLAEMTTQDGVHRHALRLPDGQVVQSTTGADVARETPPETPPPTPPDDIDAEAMMTLAESLVEGPTEAAVAFFGATPTDIDQARGQAMVGKAGVAFRELILEPLGLAREDVMVANTNTSPVVAETVLKAMRPRLVISLGKQAREDLGDAVDFTLPHPNFLARWGDKRGEMDRKIPKIRKAIENQGGTGQDVDKHDPSTAIVPICKADGAKQIVFGVVLNPYAVDAHNDWIPPADVEESAHRWLLESRVIGHQHKEMANAAPVESSLVHYPTPEDRERAMRNEPHRAFQMRYGSDIVHSGSWILGTKLGDEEWAKVQNGELNAYSIGGLGARTRIPRDQMPEVEFIDLIPA